MASAVRVQHGKRALRSAARTRSSRFSNQYSKPASTTSSTRRTLDVKESVWFAVLHPSWLPTHGRAMNSHIPISRLRE